MSPRVSFEFFPPKSIEASFRLWDTIQVLAPFTPRFVSVTYGAGGTTRELTSDAVRTLHKNTDLTVAAHLTCVNATREETLSLAKGFKETGISNLVALRGDPPKDSGAFAPSEDGFQNSVELIEALSDLGGLNLRVGAYPEKHPEAKSQQADIEWLKRKLDAGADEALTQFFFEPETFLRFRDACVKAGIDKPIIPGVLPIENWASVKRFATQCGTSIPAWMGDAFEKAARDDRETLLSTALCAELCSELIDEGVDTFHFYTLNRPELTRDVCLALGVPQKRSLEMVA